MYSKQDLFRVSKITKAFVFPPSCKHQIILHHDHFKLLLYQLTVVSKDQNAILYSCILFNTVQGDLDTHPCSLFSVVSEEMFEPFHQKLPETSWNFCPCSCVLSFTCMPEQRLVRENYVGAGGRMLYSTLLFRLSCFSCISMHNSFKLYFSKSVFFSLDLPLWDRATPIKKCDLMVLLNLLF